MAILKDTTINGDLNITGAISGPLATSSSTGLIKIGYVAPPAKPKNYPVEIEQNGTNEGKAYVNVPWIDTAADNNNLGLVKVSAFYNGIGNTGDDPKPATGGLISSFTSNRYYAVGMDLQTKYLYVNVPWTDNNTDTKNTAGSTNSTSQLYIIGATSQEANPQTYSNSKVYIKGNCLYSNGSKVSTTDTGATVVTTLGSGNAITAASYSSSDRTITFTKGTTFLTSHQTVKNSNPTLSWGTTSTIGTIGSTVLTVTMPSISYDSSTKILTIG